MDQEQITIEVKVTLTGYDTIVTMGNRCTITPWPHFADANENALMACRMFSDPEGAADIMRVIRNA
jgi:hypothetical protein